ncbi:MAG: DUF2345 domain-containing protein [Acidihalobacter sp.]
MSDPLSIEAHADALQVLADKSVTVASAGGQLKVMAKQAVVLKAGQCTVSLEGGGVTLSCPGSFTVKSASHAFMGPASQPAALPDLPQAHIQPTELTFRRTYADGSPIAGLPYTATLADGTVLRGATNAAGTALHAGVPLAASACVVYEQDPNPPAGLAAAGVDDDLKALFGRQD